MTIAQPVPVVQPTPVQQQPTAKMMESVLSDSYVRIFLNVHHIVEKFSIKIDFDKSRVLNTNDDLKRLLLVGSLVQNSGFDVRKSNAQLNSKVDAQLIIQLTFKKPVQLYSILVIGNNPPSSMLLYANKPTLDFSTVGNVAISQEVTSTYEDELEMPLKPFKFQQVSSLTIFIPGNIQKSEVTSLGRLVCFGQVSDAVTPQQVVVATTRRKEMNKQKKEIKRAIYESKPKKEKNTDSQNTTKPLHVAFPQDTSILVYPDSMTVTNDTQGNPWIEIDVEKFKNGWYTKKNGCNSEQDKHTMISTYLHGLYWNWYYYYVGTLSWKWYYPYFYSPLASDLVAYLQAIPNPTFEFEKSAPLTTVQQLVSVLPPTAKHLLPLHAQHLVDTNLELFPDAKTIKIDREGMHDKNKWDFVIHLGIPSVQALEQAVPSDSSDIKPARTVLYCYDTTVSYVHPSPLALFTAIENCHVKTQELE